MMRLMFLRNVLSQLTVGKFQEIQIIGDKQLNDLTSSVEFLTSQFDELENEKKKKKEKDELKIKFSSLKDNVENCAGIAQELLADSWIDGSKN